MTNSIRRHFTPTGILNGSSNGCLEGVNHKVKQIERTAYGYSNFRNLLIRIRLEQNITKELLFSYLISYSKLFINRIYKID